MNVLVTGRGTSGSWRIRGEQLGRAIGADVVPMALDVARYDVAVLVKRAPGDLLQRVRAGGAALIWDVVDAWPQPDGNRWSRAECLAWLGAAIERIRPQAIIAATEKMRQDVASLCTVPVETIPHHGRPGLARTEIRERLSVVAYEGSLRHLGIWADHLLRACRRRDLTVLFNPATLNDADVVVALREADGYAARHWKSNVKLANAQASGTPIICSPEAGYAETAGQSAPIFIETPAELEQALDALAPYEKRQAIADGLYAARLELTDVARRYRRFLEATCKSPAPSC